MFSQTLISATAVAIVAASSITPRQATTSPLATTLLDHIKETIVTCGTSTDEMYMLGCAEKALIGDINNIWDFVQPLLMFTSVGGAEETIDTGITALTNAVSTCVENSVNSTELARCNGENTMDNEVLDNFVAHFVLPMATCETAEDIALCVDDTIAKGLVLAQPTLDELRTVVSARSISPREVAPSALAAKLLASIKNTIVTCSDSDTYMLGCAETALITQVNELWGHVYPLLMFTSYRTAALTIDAGIASLTAAVNECVASSDTSAKLAVCNGDNTLDNEILDRFVKHFVVPVAACDVTESDASIQIVTECVDMAVEDGLVLAQPTLEEVAAQI